MRKSGLFSAFLAVSTVGLAALGCGPPPKPAVVAVAAPPPPPPRVVQVARPVDPQVVDLTGTAGSTAVLAATASDVTVRVRVEARALPRTQRPPLNVALVIDTSGSMAGKPIEDARAAAAAFVEQLAAGDRLAVVVFHSFTEILQPSIVISDKNRADILARIAKMEATGTTDMAGGLQTGLQLVTSAYRQDGLNRIVLLGDGVPNNPAALPGIAAQAAASKITLTMLGLGVDYDETLMASLAQQSGGTYRYIDDSAKVAEVFQDEVTRMTRVVARGIQLRLQAGPGVTIKSISGQPGYGGAAAQLGLGDLSENERRDLIVRLSVPGRKEGVQVEILDAAISFEDMVVGAGQLSRRAFVGALAADAKAVAAGEDDEVMRFAARADLAEATLAAIAAARAGNVGEARSILDRAVKLAQAALAKREDAELKKALTDIPALKQSLPALAPPQEIVEPTPTEGPPGKGGGRGKKTPRPTPPSYPEPPSNAGSVIKESQNSAADTVNNPRPMSPR